MQAGISDFIRLTWTCDSISFLVSLVLCLTLQALRDDSLYDIFQKGSKTKLSDISKTSNNVRLAEVTLRLCKTGVKR